MPRGVQRYVTVLTVVATIVVATVALVGSHAGTSWFLVACLATGLGLTLALPLRIAIGSEVEGLEFQEALVLPAMLLLPAGVAIPAFGTVAVVAMVIRKRGWLRGSFNAAQWIVSIAAGFGVHRLLTAGVESWSAVDVVAALVAVSVCSLVNLVAVALVISLSTGRPAVDVVRAGLVVRVALWASNISLGMLLGVVARHDVGYLPLALVPVLLLHLSYRAMAERRADGVQLQRLAEAEADIASVFTAPEVADVLADRVVDLLRARGASVHVRWFDGELTATSGDPTDAHLPARGAGSIRHTVHDGDDVSVTVTVNARSNLDPYVSRDEQVVDALAHRGAAALARLRLFAQIEVERRKMTDVVTSSSDGIFSVDTEQRIQSWNPAMERITGFPSADVVGSRCFTVFRPRDEAGSELCVASCPGRCGHRDAVPVQITTITGEHRWLTCTYAAMPDGGYVVVARDITTQKQVDDLKADFLATVSHELRTPLTPIQGFLHTLMRDDVTFGDAQRQRFYEVMLRQSERLERLVKDLLDATTLQDPDQLFLPEEVDWASAVHQVVDAFRAQEQDRDYVVEIGDIPHVVADEQRAEQVLSNLLSNALKYSDAGTAIRVTVESRDGHVVTTVSDRGPGVPPADRERIFERFTRLGDHMTRKVGGAGLGLFIAKRLVEGMGGTIAVGPAPDGGAAFSFSLPQYEGARTRFQA